MNLNRAMLIGNLTQDPELRTTPDGTEVASFTVATNMRWTDKQGQTQERAEYHPIVAWRKLAEICGKFLKKGRKVYVEGRLQTRSWDDPNGNKRYKTEIVAENIILLDRKDSNYSSNEQSSGPQISNLPEENNKETINVDDIPF